MTPRVRPFERDSRASQPRDAVARTYDRVAAVYDLYDAPMEALGGSRRRRRLLARARGSVLEVGIGTGRNLPYYPDGVTVTGIDVSPNMLRRAQRRASDLGRPVSLLEADVESLPFDDEAFDTVVATCVFCSVSDPLRGLQELQRVVRRDGEILLLEHVRPTGRALGFLADALTPVTRRLVGPAMNRRTEETVLAAGIRLIDIRREAIWREIVGRPAKSDR
jgi:ubiquinone/menaquinone biosynthesis C-methylase UbiE